MRKRAGKELVMRTIRSADTNTWEVFSGERREVIKVRLPDDLPEEELMKRYMAHSNTAAGGARGLRKVFRDGSQA